MEWWGGRSTPLTVLAKTCVWLFASITNSMQLSSELQNRKKRNGVPKSSQKLADAQGPKGGRFETGV
jgi:hypothetical protein